MKIKLLLVVLFSSLALSAQESNLILRDLSNFQTQAGNWKIVGDVTMDRHIDVHPHPKSDKESKRQYRRRKKEQQKAVVFSTGKGILLNINDASKKDALITSMEHGDILLDLDVMLPKGSNSGIYLQGRYELQLYDSWGVKSPKFSDIGGIYRNWDNRPGKIFRGISPSSNASKAPGLWQHLKVHFQAPRFDSKGNKISNAKFIYVKLNGVNIHTNIEVPLPTGGPISKKEVSKGPIMIQGDHGPVAFKNFKYILIEDSSVTVPSLSYKTYKGAFKDLNDLKKATISTKGGSRLIDINVTDEEDNYGVIYNGTLNVAKTDTYTISLGYTGGANLYIDGEKIIEDNSSGSQRELKKSLQLSSGSHTFSLSNIKSVAWRAPRLGLSIGSETSNSKILNTYDSYPPNSNSVSPIFVNADAQPKLLRGFVNFNGKGERLSHTIGVGTPGGVNFVFDLESANLIGVWRGDFADATPMWHNRGNGSFTPQGAVQWTFLNQPIAQLSSKASEFPKTGSSPDYKAKGYSIDKKTKLPVFTHEYKGVVIKNTITPDLTNTYFSHTISFSKNDLKNWYHKIAEGTIKKMPDGSFAIDGQRYYIKIISEQTPIIRNVNGVSELIVAVDGNSITYEIIW